MAVKSPPALLQTGSYSAEDLRAYLTSQLAGRGGIVTTGALAVTQNGTPNMSVNVAVGDAFVPGTEATEQGVYLVENRSSVVNVAVAASHATLNRYDIVYAQVRDQAYSGVSNDALIGIVAGTAAASPAEPTIPANAIQLARVAISAGVTSITTSNIVDRRYTTTKGMAAALGGTIVTTSGNRPTTNLHAGLRIFETDTARFLYYTGSGWANEPGVPSAWAATPAFENSWSNLGGVHQVAQYRKVGDVVQVRGMVTGGTVGAVAFTLPAGHRPPATLVFITLQSGGPPDWGRIDVNTAGQVILAATAPATNSFVAVNFQFSTI